MSDPQNQQTQDLVHKEDSVADSVALNSVDSDSVDLNSASLSRIENKFISPPRWLSFQDKEITAEISQEYDEWTAHHGCTPAVRKCALDYLNRDYPVYNDAGHVVEAIPTTEGMALWLKKKIDFDVDSRTIKKWFANNTNDFARLQAKKRDIQVVTLSAGGLSGRFERSLSRTMLARQGIRDDSQEGVLIQVVDKFREDT